MKKLLVATSALVAAGSAAALEVSLGGSVNAAVNYLRRFLVGPDHGAQLTLSGLFWC